MRLVLFCQEVPELKLGPGRLDDETNLIRFRDGFAYLEEDDPDFDEKRRWLTAAGTPPIEILGSEEAEGRTLATELSEFPCPRCGKAFATQKSLNGHIFGAHRPNAGGQKAKPTPASTEA